MNANELADSLEAASSDMEYNYHVSDWKLLYECALVMRKQQAEIGFYKQDADKYKQKCASQQAEIEALKRHRNKLETLAEKMLQGSGEEDEQ